MGGCAAASETGLNSAPRVWSQPFAWAVTGDNSFPSASFACHLFWSFPAVRPGGLQSAIRSSPFCRCSGFNPPTLLPRLRQSGRRKDRFPSEQSGTHEPGKIATAPGPRQKDSLSNPDMARWPESCQPPDRVGQDPQAGKTHLEPMRLSVGSARKSAGGAGPGGVAHRLASASQPIRQFACGLECAILRPT